MPTGNENIITEISALSPTALIELYELDLSSMADFYGIPEEDRRYYLHAGTNELNNPVVWQGITYAPFPMQITGFEMSTQGELPRPNLQIANISGLISALVNNFDDLVGASFIRRRTFAKFLDAVNFTGGVNPDADPTAEYPLDTYRIDRKSGETAEIIEFELGTLWDVEGVQLPRRQILPNLCPWKYRKAGCNYNGPAVADATDSPLDPANYGGDLSLVNTLAISADVCGKRVTSCNLRFGHLPVIPFGGFPTAGLFKR